MQTLFKWIAQFLLIPLIKEFVIWANDQYKKHQEKKQLEKENSKKGNAYDVSSPDRADEDFRNLP
jgi:hypothetical protein